MKFKDQLAKATRLPRNILPSSYQILGKVLLLKLNTKALKEKKKIASAILKIFPHIKTVALQKGISGELRKPSVEILAGKGLTEITHNELGCSFNLDITKVMWSKGNHFERSRLVNLVRPGELIVDLFAGIGYFSLILAKHTKASRIICLEKNPDSFSYLVDNIVLNKLHNVTAIEDDCRNFALKKKKADRILMGYFPNTIKFLPAAMKLAKEGTVMHYHDLTTDPKKLALKIKRAAKGRVKILNVREVKKYSPSKRHYVFDLQVTRTA